MTPEEFAAQLGATVEEDNTQQQLNPDEFASQLGGQVEDSNPVLSAMKDPKTSNSAIGASLNQTNSLLDKLINVGQGASNLLFGSTSKTVGSLIGSGYESARDLIGKPVENRAFTDETGMSLYQKETSGAGKATDIAFTGLELMPGGGVLGKHLRKLPGGEFVAKNITDKLAKIPENMKAKALEQYTSIFRAGSKESKALTEKVAPKLLEDGKIITSLKSLKEGATKQTKLYGEQIGEWFKKLPAGARREVEPVVKKLQTLKSQYRIAGKDINKTAISAVDDIIDNIKTQSGEMSIKNLRKLRQIWDEHYNVSKGLDDIANYKKKAERVGADAIRDILSKESPELAKLNQTFSFWKNVEKLADYSAQKAPLKLASSAAKVVGGTIGAIAGTGTGGKIGSAIIGSQVGNAVNKVISSPAWKSVSAVYKNKMANYMMSESVSKLKGVLRRVSTIVKNAVE
jgi:hypothetical protein